jgi:hypothetical protein
VVPAPCIAARFATGCPAASQGRAFDRPLLGACATRRIKDGADLDWQDARLSRWQRRDPRDQGVAHLEGDPQRGLRRDRDRRARQRNRSPRCCRLDRTSNTDSPRTRPPSLIPGCRDRPDRFPSGQVSGKRGISGRPVACVFLCIRPYNPREAKGGNVAEAIMVVCDECGKPDATSITIRAGQRNYVKDLCRVHLAALLKDTRAPRRGRPRASGSSSARRSKPSGAPRRGGRAATKATGARKRSARKKSAATRR